MTYPRIELPPSSVGAVHDNVMLLSVFPVQSTTPGLDGGSEDRKAVQFRMADDLIKHCIKM